MLMHCPRLTPASLLALAVSLCAEALLVEPFAYPDGELSASSAGTWVVAVDGGNPSLRVEGGRLVWDFTVPSANPVNNGYYGRTLPGGAVASGALYAHFNLTVEEAPAVDGNTSGLIAGFWNGSSGVRARVWLGLGVTAAGAPVSDTFRIGLTEASGSRASIVWDSTQFPEGTTVRVVVKYDFTTDRAMLLLDAETESDVAVSADDGSALGLAGFVFRHRDEGDMGRFFVDDLALSEAFEDTGVAGVDPPTKLAAAAVPGVRVILTWEDNTATETGFLVERKSGGGAYAPLATTRVNEHYFIDAAVTPGTAYTYRVSALGTGNATPTNEATATALADPVVEVVPALEIDLADGDLTLVGTAQRGVSHWLEESADAAVWTRLGPPRGGAEGPWEATLEDPSGPRFYRIAGTLYPVPAAVGLTEPFQLPRNGGGATLDVTAYGATAGQSADDDATAFLAAIAAAAAGDTIYVPAGIYHIRTPIVIKSGLSVVGENRDTTILLSDTGTLSSALRIPSGASDITIADLSVDLASGVLTDAVLIGTSSGSVVDRVWLRNLRLEHFQRRGVLVRQARHVKVEGLHIRNATNLGGGGNGYGIVLNDPMNNNNWVTGCVIGPVIRHGVLIQYRAHHNLVEYTTCFETTEDAFDLHGEDEYANELRFNLAFWANPTGETSRGFGIGNTGSTHDDTGPFNWIHHNEVYGYQGGLEVINNSHHQFIDGNYFHDNFDYGIRLHNRGGDGVLIRGNLIENNGEAGVEAFSSHGLRVQGNTIRGHDVGVVVAADSLGFEIRDNDLSGNTVPTALAHGDGVYTGNSE